MPKSEKANNSSSTEEEEVVLLQVDTGDIIKLKQILDETVANTFLSENSLEDHDPRAKNIGLVEDHKLNNIKLILMTVACIFAMIAQFSPLPFPESRLVLGFCCAVYFMLSGMLQLIQTFVDKDCILITKPVNSKFTSKDNLKKNPNLTKQGLRVRSIFPKFSEFYTVRIEFQDMDDGPFVNQTWSVGKFFDKEGMFDEYGLQYEVEALFRNFESGKFDTDDAAKAKKE